MILLIIWNAIVHFMGVDYGVAYGHWIWYNFWSGVGGSFLVGAIAYTVLHYIHGTCHASPWCLRWGKYPAADGLFKLCHKHHPDLNGKKPRMETILKLHRSRQCSGTI